MFMKELVHAFSCAFIESWIYLGSFESIQKARVANSYASLALSKLSPHINNSIYSVFTHVASIYANSLEHQRGRRFNVSGQQYGRHDVM